MYNCFCNTFVIVFIIIVKVCECCEALVEFVPQAKKRWAGKTIVDLFADEFKGRPRDYYVCGYLFVLVFDWFRTIYGL